MIKEMSPVYTHQGRSPEEKVLISRRKYGMVIGGILGGALGLTVDAAKPENQTTKIGRGTFVAKTLFFVLSGMISGLVVADNTTETSK